MNCEQKNNKITKGALTNYFVWKIEVAKQSRIIIKKDNRIFSSTRSNDLVTYKIFKSLDEEISEEDIEKTWKDVGCRHLNQVH